VPREVLAQRQRPPHGRAPRRADGLGGGDVRPARTLVRVPARTPVPVRELRPAPEPHRVRASLLRTRHRRSAAVVGEGRPAPRLPRPGQCPRGAPSLRGSSGTRRARVPGTGTVETSLSTRTNSNLLKGRVTAEFEGFLHVSAQGSTTAPTTVSTTHRNCPISRGSVWPRSTSGSSASPSGGRIGTRASSSAPPRGRDRRRAQIPLFWDPTMFARWVIDREDSVLSGKRLD